MSSDELHVAGESFVEPNCVPPLHRDQISKPLVSQFVRVDDGHSLFLTSAGCFGIDEHIRFSAIKFCIIQ